MRKTLWIFGIFIITVTMVGSAYILFPSGKRSADAHNHSSSDSSSHEGHHQEAAAEVDGEMPVALPLDPTAFDYGTKSSAPNGQTVKDFEIGPYDGSFRGSSVPGMDL
jgi:hypothetical protein